jgi:hypothetical protein
MVDKCKICGVNSAESHPVNGDFSDQTCDSCGHFKISGSAAAVNIDGDRPLIKIRGHIQRYGTTEKPALLDVETMNLLAAAVFPSVSQRAEFLLQEVHRSTTYLGQKIDVLTKRIVALTYSIVDSDVRFLADYLAAEGYVEKTIHGDELLLNMTPKGFSITEKHQPISNKTKGNVFVAMWFADEVQDAWEFGIKAAVTACGYHAVRIDEVHHHEKIDDRILRGIREADFVIADLTGHRGGVYFEAGFAMALNKPVIWSCRRDEFEKTHFDVNHYHIIQWESAGDLHQKLEDKLMALFGLEERTA